MTGATPMVGAAVRHPAAWRLVGPLTVVLLWQAASWRVPPVMVPPPRAVAAAVAEIVASGALWPNVARSLQTIATGFTIAFTAGAAIGLVMGASGWWHGFFRDVLHATLMMPGLVVVVVVTMLLGIGQATAVTAVVLTAVPYAALNVAEGVRALPADLLDMAAAHRVPRRRQLRDIVLPASAPYLLTAARFVFSLCWQTTTLAEVIGGTRGIGFMMRRAFQVFDMAGFIAWCGLFFAFTIIVERVVLQRLVERSQAWRGAAGSGAGGTP